MTPNLAPWNKYVESWGMNYEYCLPGTGISDLGPSKLSHFSNADDAGLPDASLHFEAQLF
jgi:hypothetical protein